MNNCTVYSLLSLNLHVALSLFFYLSLFNFSTFFSIPLFLSLFFYLSLHLFYSNSIFLYFYFLIFPSFSIFSSFSIWFSWLLIRFKLWSFFYSICSFLSFSFISHSLPFSFKYFYTNFDCYILSSGFYLFQKQYILYTFLVDQFLGLDLEYCIPRIWFQSFNRGNLSLSNFSLSLCFSLCLPVNQSISLSLFIFLCFSLYLSLLLFFLLL